MPFCRFSRDVAHIFIHMLKLCEGGGGGYENEEQPENADLSTFLVVVKLQIFPLCWLSIHFAIHQMSGVRHRQWKPRVFREILIETHQLLCSDAWCSTDTLYIRIVKKDDVIRHSGTGRVGIRVWSSGRAELFQTDNGNAEFSTRIPLNTSACIFFYLAYFSH